MIKAILSIFVFLLVIFLLDKIEITAPTTLIKKEITNDDFSEKFKDIIIKITENAPVKIIHKDKKYISLDNWDKFERNNQDTFSNMYQFWIRKI